MGSDSHEKKRSKHSHSKHRSSKPVEEEEWVEKLPTPAGPPIDPPSSTFTPSNLKDTAPSFMNLTDGYGDGEVGDSTATEATNRGDFFSDFGVERKRKPVKQGVDPTQTMGQSSRELNKQHWQPNAVSTPQATASTSTAPGKIVPGSSGSNWRMAKVKRTYEQAAEENRELHEVALEKYGSMVEWEAALEERSVLDSRRGGSSRDSRPRYEPGGGRNGGEGDRRNSAGGGDRRKFIYNDSVSTTPISRPSSRNESFRRPGEATPINISGTAPRTGSTADRASAAGGGVRTPIPSVFTPTLVRNQSSNLATNPITSSSTNGTDGAAGSSSTPVLDQSQLNKLQAQVLKARLMDLPNADALEASYELERKRFVDSPSLPSASTSSNIQVMPTLDARGKLYDVGLGLEKPEDEVKGKVSASGRIRKPKEKAFVSHDVATGELIQRNLDDDTSLAELVRQEKFSGGSGAHRGGGMDDDMANKIMSDGKFVNSLDYADENAELLARKKMKSEVLKKAFAVNDYAKTKKALDSCTLCHPETGGPPKAAIVALGHYTYLSLLENEELVSGHCRIVPVQHHFSTLEAEDDCWDEIKNFMKTLMQMFATQDKGVIFFESVLNLKHQKHTYIECIPIDFQLFDEIPAYFSEALSSSESVWSTHKAVLPFSPARPFRRSLVSNLPYFMIQWDYKGEKGYGHVIEGVDDAPEVDADGDQIRGEVGEKGGGEFTRYFAQEIIGNLLELSPRQWRKPRRIDFSRNKERVANFRLEYDKYDWTKLI